MRVSIVGGCGFIGLSLFSYLTKKNYEILIIDTNKRFLRTNLNKKNFRQVNYKSLDSIKKAIKGTSILINMYSSMGPSTSMKASKKKLASDIKINKTIFQVAKKLSVDKVIFTSSGGTVYGDKPNMPINENFSKVPISNYGKIKSETENELIKISLKKYYILRIANIYGPLQFKYSNVGIIAKIIESINNNKELIIWGDGSIIRDYIYIDDLSNFIEILINKDIRKGTYNVSSSVGASINQIISKINKIANKKCNVKFVKKRKFDISINVLSYDKAYKKAKWKPKVNLDSGIEEMFKKYQSTYS